jgi:tRNA nucleotidyltransferase (CCA-adding enzyme)
VTASEHWSHFEHRADIGIEGCGETPAAAFEQAALALTAIICDPVLVEPATRVSILCDEPDLALLFVDWLNALIYQMATERMLFGRFQVCIEAGHLRAEAWGEPVIASKHQPAVEVKGATYTALSVQQTIDDGWCARCVVDV